MGRSFKVPLWPSQVSSTAKKVMPRTFKKKYYGKLLLSDNSVGQSKGPLGTVNGFPEAALGSSCPDCSNFLGSQQTLCGPERSI